jgi:hypothetical protein
MAVNLTISSESRFPTSLFDLIWSRGTPWSRNKDAGKGAQPRQSAFYGSEIDMLKAMHRVNADPFP